MIAVSASGACTYPTSSARLLRNLWIVQDASFAGCCLDQAPIALEADLPSAPGPRAHGSIDESATHRRAGVLFRYMSASPIAELHHEAENYPLGLGKRSRERSASIQSRFQRRIFDLAWEPGSVPSR